MEFTQSAGSFLSLRMSSHCPLPSSVCPLLEQELLQQDVCFFLMHRFVCESSNAKSFKYVCKTEFCCQQCLVFSPCPNAVHRSHHQHLHSSSDVLRSNNVPKLPTLCSLSEQILFSVFWAFPFIPLMWDKLNRFRTGVCFHCHKCPTEHQWCYHSSFIMTFISVFVLFSLLQNKYPSIASDHL